LATKDALNDRRRWRRNRREEKTGHVIRRDRVMGVAKERKGEDRTRDMM
jgi:hypothetical protein